jgi:hypothetical protein
LREFKDLIVRTSKNWGDCHGCVSLVQKIGMCEYDHVIPPKMMVYIVLG